MISCVLIIPANLRDSANQLSVFMDWGPNSYSVPLSGDGSEPATHYGLHSWVTEAFEPMLAGPMPTELADGGYPEASYNAIIGSLISSFRDDNTGHFEAVLADNGLFTVQGKSE